MIIRDARLPTICADVVCSPVSDGAVLLSTRREVYYGLNLVGARVMDLLSEVDTLDALVTRLAEEYPDAPKHVIRSDVEELLEELEANELIESVGAACQLA